METNQNNSAEKTEEPQKVTIVLPTRKKRKCIVCRAPNNVEVTEKYLNNEITYKEAGELVGCHYQSFYTHMQTCVIPVLEKDPTFAPNLHLEVNKIRILEDMINKFYARAQLLLSQEDMSGIEIKNVTSELRGFIETLAKITKELGPDISINLESESSIFKKAAEEVLMNEDPSVWKKVRAKMIELSAAQKALN